MIKLKSVPKPKELTKAEQIRLTNLFKKTGDSVWKTDYIRKALLSMSNEKCCYCECNISEESKYFEVEHYLHKHKYKLYVLEWSNLLPSCKRCNGTKNDHDVKLKPIIHPVKIDPKQHLIFNAYRIKGKDTLGIETENAVDLNNTDKVVIVRFRLGEKLTNGLESLFDLTQEYFIGHDVSTRRRNRISSILKGLLTECSPSNIYSATLSTVLLKVNYSRYKEVKAMFRKRGLWDNELKKLEKEVKSSALNCK